MKTKKLLYLFIMTASAVSCKPSASAPKSEMDFFEAKSGKKLTFMHRARQHPHQL